MAKPFGTFTPWDASSRYISPSEAFFPPTSGISSMPMSSNQRIEDTACVTTAIEHLTIWNVVQGILILRVAFFIPPLRMTSPSPSGAPLLPLHDLGPDRWNQHDLPVFEVHMSHIAVS